MKVQHIRLLILCSPLVFFLPPLSAQQPDAVAMLNNLKVKIFGIIGARAPDESSSSTFVLCSPGIPIDTGIDLTDPEQVQSISDVLNRIPLGDVYGGLVTGQVDTDSIPSVYGRIVKGYKSTLPDPSAADKQKLADLNKRWSDLTDKYNQYYQIWVNAVAAWKWASVSPNRDDRQKAPGLKATADSALDDLEAANKGNSGAYKDALNDWYNFQDRMNGGEPWSDRVDAYRKAGNAGYPVKTWPQYKSWTDGSGWTKITISSSDLQTNTHSSSVSMGGSAGFFGFGAKAGKTQDISVTDENRQNLSITMEMKRVLLLRDSWLDGSVFRSQKWVWRDSDEAMISTGHFNSATKAFEGRMPLYPTSLLLVRNVILKSNWGSDVNSISSSKVDASGGWSFGPFSVGGSYGNSKSDKHARAQGSDAGLEIPDVQILGWFCVIIPRCPFSQPTPTPTPGPHAQ